MLLDHVRSLYCICTLLCARTAQVSLTSTISRIHSRRNVLSPTDRRFVSSLTSSTLFACGPTTECNPAVTHYATLCGRRTLSRFMTAIHRPSTMRRLKFYWSAYCCSRLSDTASKCGRIFQMKKRPLSRQCSWIRREMNFCHMRRSVDGSIQEMLCTFKKLLPLVILTSR